MRPALGNCSAIPQTRASLGAAASVPPCKRNGKRPGLHARRRSLLAYGASLKGRDQAEQRRNMFGYRFIKTQPTEYVILYRNGRPRREGLGLSF